MYESFLEGFWFRSTKRGGWQWQQTHMSDPARMEEGVPAVEADEAADVHAEASKRQRPDGGWSKTGVPKRCRRPP